jgi:hypothetical protein
MSTDQELNEGQELVEAPTNEIQVFSEFDARISELKEHLTNKEYNLTTEEGKEEAEKDKSSLRKVEIKIEKKRVLKGAGLLKATRKLNADAKAYHSKVHGLWEIIDKPLQIIRQAELDAVMDKRDEEIADAKRIQDEKDAELEKLRGIVAKQEADAKAIEDAAQAERDAAERKDELEAAALLAAENAKLQAKQDAIDAAAKAEQDKSDAVAEVERKAKADAAILAKEIADKYEAEQAEQRKIDADLKAKAANVEHQKDFNNTAVFAIESILLNSEPTTGSKELSIAIVTAIAKRQIPNVTINY